MQIVAFFLNFCSKSDYRDIFEMALYTLVTVNPLSAAILGGVQCG